MKKKWLFIPLIVLGGIVATAATAVGVLNLLKYPIYIDYYRIENKVAKLPKFSDGYVHQGTTVFEENEKPYYVTCGYMTAKGAASRIYITDEHNNRKHVELKNPDGTNFVGHTGGISSCKNGKTYLASGSSIYEIPTSELSLSSNVNEIKLEKEYKMNHSCSCISCIDDFVWIAEFRGHEYVCTHEYQTSEGKNHAIAVKYNINDLTKPLEVYSVRDLVQGITQNPDNKEVVLSCSYGLADSHYYLYNESNVETLSGQTLWDCPVKAFVNPYRTVKAPAMSEDLEYYKGKVYTAQESGSKKYIYGILFGDKYIHSLDFWNVGK